MSQQVTRKVTIGLLFMASIIHEYNILTNKYSTDSEKEVCNIMYKGLSFVFLFLSIRATCRVAIASFDDFSSDDISTVASAYKLIFMLLAMFVQLLSLGRTSGVWESMNKFLSRMEFCISSMAILFKWLEKLEAQRNEGERLYIDGFRQYFTWWRFYMAIAPIVYAFIPVYTVVIWIIINITLIISDEVYKEPSLDDWSLYTICGNLGKILKKIMMILFNARASLSWLLILYFEIINPTNNWKDFTMIALDRMKVTRGIIVGQLYWYHN